MILINNYEKKKYDGENNNKDLEIRIYSCEKQK